MPRITTVKAAQKDQGQCSKCGTPIVKGDGYLWWKFMRGARYVRCLKPECRPKPQDLTRSEWVQRCAEFGEQVGDICSTYRSGGQSAEDLAGEIESLAGEVREFGEEQRGKFDNMPEGLQQGETGQLLEERADMMDTAADELDEVATSARDLELIDVDDESSLKEWSETDDCSEDRGEYESDEDFMEAVKAAAQETNDQAVEEVLSALEGVSIGD